MNIPQRLDALRAQMARRNIDAYIVVTDDFHGSEYVGDYFKVREYLTGFTGSAGTLVVTGTMAALWTDGRYFLQAERQLCGTGIELMRIGEENVPTIPEYLARQLPEAGVIGFDGRCVSSAFVEQIAQATLTKGITFAYREDLADAIWTERPELPGEQIWELDVSYTGLSREDKLARLRETMEEEQVDELVLTALDEIAWLLNLRGGDVQCTPVFLAYMLIGRENAILFVQGEALKEELRCKLEECGITTMPYNSIYEELSRSQDGKRLLLDDQTANYLVVQSIPSGVEIRKKSSPVIAMKAVKTSREMENIRAAHVKDGVAVTRFIYWLKHRVSGENPQEEAGESAVGKQTPVTELAAAEKLEQFRRQQEGYLGPSFDPILAYGEHGAIVHYEPTEETDAELSPRGLCLADTGGHYMEGTTDITRTIALGELTQEEKWAYSVVLRGHLNLGAAIFPYGARGVNLDAFAREPLWENGLDYNHGTGHGVGYVLSVHEGPQRFHWRIKEHMDSVVLEEGMVISNEPGVYLAGKFGIRHENLVLVQKGDKNAYGQFMYLEPLTMVPFDRDAILPDVMSDRELELLNAYHKKVYDAIEAYLPEEERAWLERCTAPIYK